MIKAVIFDFFGVLAVDYTRQLSQTHTPEIAQAISDVDRASDLGYITDDELMNEIAAITSQDVGAIRDQILHQTQLDLAMLAVVGQARRQFATGLLSNAGHTTLDSYWSRAERDKYFDAIVVSAEVGLVEPDPQIYELICRKLNVDPSEAFFIDDIEHNVSGARQVGLSAVVFESPAQIAAILAGL